MTEVAKKLKYLRINSVQVAHKGACFVDMQGALEKKMGGVFEVHTAIAERV